MPKSEDVARAKYERAGWKVLHRGAPDFLLTKAGEKPRFVEVKCGADKLSTAQEEWIAALRVLGAECTVEFVEYSPRGVRVSMYLSRKAYDWVEETRGEAKRSTFISKIIERSIPPGWKYTKHTKPGEKQR